MTGFLKNRMVCSDFLYRPRYLALLAVEGDALQRLAIQYEGLRIQPFDRVLAKGVLKILHQALPVLRAN